MDIELKLNARVEIQVEEEIFKSNIQNIASDRLLISLPVRDGVYFTPSRGDLLEVYYYHGIDIYKFSSKVIGRISENNIPMLAIEYPEDMVKIQRREFVRINVMYDIKYKMLEKKAGSSDSYIESEQSYDGTVLDISGGGFRLSTKNKLKMQDMVLANLKFESKDLEVIGEIVRIELVDNRYIYGVSLVNIDENMRDRLINHIFGIMRKQKRNMQ